MSKPSVVACPRCAATINGDSPACPKCGQSMRLTPTMRRLETIVDGFLDFFWKFMGLTLAHLILYALIFAVLAFCIVRSFPNTIPW